MIKKAIKYLNLFLEKCAPKSEPLIPLDSKQIAISVYIALHSEKLTNRFAQKRSPSQRTSPSLRKLAFISELEDCVCVPFENVQ